MKLIGNIVAALVVTLVALLLLCAVVAAFLECADLIVRAV